VTFLFTDVEGSTRLWEAHPEPMRAALVEHDALIEFLTAQHGGVVVRPRGEGDSRFCVFARATDAVAAAAAIHQALHAVPWPAETPLRVRLAVHTGEADLREGDYYGGAVNRAARLRAIAHGGQALLSVATYDLVREAPPAGVSLRDLGEHRLSDLARPERVFQVQAPGTPAAFPPLRSLDALPHNLPLQLTSFVGRAQELVEVARLLGTTRLLTLTGPGGTGKTRLAQQAAAEALVPAAGQVAFAEGVWLVELAALADPALVPQAVATAVGVREEPGRPLLATLADALRPKRLLLLLDNCEHLLDACARLADALLRACAHLQILATSREALGIAGETAWRVPSLTLPDASGTEYPPPLEALTHCEAVRLFIDRAQAARPSFRVTAQNAPAVAQVCQRLDGIPLAIELAAARVRVLPPEQLLTHLEDRFRLLTGGSRTALERHQTLRAAVDWSYHLLTEPEQRLFSRVSVFAGGWTLDAVEAVGADEGISGEAIVGEGTAAADVLDLLTHLLDKSLVVEDELDGAARYRLLQTLRQYRQQKLAASGAAERIRERHAAYYLAVAEAAAPQLVGADQLPRLARLDREHDNLRAALDWCAASGRAEPGLRLGVALWRFWEARGHRTEGRARLAQLLALPGAAARSALRASALSAAQVLAHQQGDWAAARELEAESLVISRALRDPAGEARSLYHLGVIAYMEGDPAAARGPLEEALALQRDLHDRAPMAWSLRFLGMVAFDHGDLPLAEALMEESLALSRAAGERRGIAVSLGGLGRVALEQGRVALAGTRLREGLALLRDLRDGYLIALALASFALEAAAQGRAARAVRLAGAAEALADAIGTPLPPPVTAPVQRWLAPARQALNEEVQAAAWAAGQAMSLEQAVADALEEASGDG
jgi:predicted ATPase/class 3 adenylate cyclase